MADFYVHWNTVTHKVKIHRNTCGACKDGAGMHEGRIAAARGITYDWVAAETYPQARQTSDKLIEAHPGLIRYSDKRDCGLCRPARNSN